MSGGERRTHGSEMKIKLNLIKLSVCFCCITYKILTDLKGNVLGLIDTF